MIILGPLQSAIESLLDLLNPDFDVLCTPLSHPLEMLLRHHTLEAFNEHCRKIKRD
jgi:hypothetical protein